MWTVKYDNGVTGIYWWHFLYAKMEKVMVKVKITDRLIKLEGHAGFHENGHDLVCCAISALTCNVINSLDNLTESEIKHTEEHGNVEIQLERLDEKGKLLVDSWYLGLVAINQEYGCISFENG